MNFTQINKRILTSRRGQGGGPLHEYSLIIGLGNVVLIATLTVLPSNHFQFLPSLDELWDAAIVVFPYFFIAMEIFAIILLLKKFDTIRKNLIRPFWSWFRDFQFRRFIYLENYESGQCSDPDLLLLMIILPFLVFAFRGTDYLAAHPSFWILPPLFLTLIKISWSRHEEFVVACRYKQALPHPSWKDLPCWIMEKSLQLTKISVIIPFFIAFLFAPVLLPAYAAMTYFLQFFLQSIQGLSPSQIKGFSGLSSIATVTVCLVIFLYWFSKRKS